MMIYECCGCGAKGAAGDGKLGDVYPRMVLNWRSEILCSPCKARLETYLTEQWRNWFKLPKEHPLTAHELKQLQKSPFRVSLEKPKESPEELLGKVRILFTVHSCPRDGAFCWRCAAAAEVEKVLGEKVDGGPQ